MLVLILGSLGYYGPSLSRQPTPQIQPPPEVETGTQLKVSHRLTMISLTFPFTINATCVISNDGGSRVGSLEVLQMTPKGFEITRSYLLDQQGTKTDLRSASTSQGFRCLEGAGLESRRKLCLIVLLRFTSESESGNFTTEARGLCDGKQVRSQASSWIEAPPERATCVDSAAIPFGDFLLENNVWGGPGEPHVQWIKASSASFGWNWSRLGSAQSSWSHRSPYYPEVICGKKPWRDSSTTKILPFLIESLDRLEVSLCLSMQAFGDYNLALDLWVTNDVQANPESITDEIMIWFVWTHNVGKIVSTMNDGYNGYEYRVYESGGWGYRFHQFTLVNQAIPTKINLLAFLNNLAGRGYDLRYLASIELGNEVWGGTGETAISELGIDMSTKAKPRSTPMTSWVIRGLESLCGERECFILGKCAHIGIGILVIFGLESSSPRWIRSFGSGKVTEN